MTCSSYNSEVSSVNMSLADLENMYNCSCEKALLNDSRSLRRQGKDHGHLYHLLQSSTAAGGTHAQWVRPWCQQSLEAGNHRCWHSVSSLSLSLSLSSFYRPFSKWTWVSRCLLKQRMMEVVVTTGAISRAKLQSYHHNQQTNTQFFFTGRMPFLKGRHYVSYRIVSYRIKEQIKVT